ncbi:hypothetical protein HPB50_007111 [Hyalomma asiaticum]|uniref:Uncharacterized protein n=1 Tax=Hyalomma asiaticum TaxID=266040 RepID=A0ACB7STW6_HYAAI|nr:hypothetical protein HPB50_007111 [Hyalomma asiaticum]
MRAARNRTINEIGGGLATTGTSSIPTTTAMTSTMWPSTTMPTPPLLGHALRPPRPTVSLDARPVLIPILSSVICFPIVALAVICALRYRALRLRRKEHLRRLRGGGGGSCEDCSRSGRHCVSTERLWDIGVATCSTMTRLAQEATV